MDERIREQITNIRAAGIDKLQQIDYFRHLIADKEVSTFEDIGFCYWNISDNYAMLRDGNAVLLNHQQFFKHINAGDPVYLFWLVCDATQRLTLEMAGYSDFWWSLYQEAVQQQVGSTYYFAEFSAHRAALYINPDLSHNKHNLEIAKIKYEKFLDKAKDTMQYEFYKIIYLSLASRFSSVDKLELRTLCENLFDGLLSVKRNNDFLLGEWRAVVTPFDKYKQSSVGINSAINAFIYSGELNVAKELYTQACAFGMERNLYIEAKL